MLAGPVRFFGVRLYIAAAHFAFDDRHVCSPFRINFYKAIITQQKQEKNN